MDRTEIYNREVRAVAQYRASQMAIWPSPLEEEMKKILEGNNIEYEFQKIFYIYEGSMIIRYYIADFFVPKANLIIEVDGKFHDKHRLHDKNRTKEIQRENKDVEVLRFNRKDLHDPVRINDLLFRIKEAE